VVNTLPPDYDYVLVPTTDMSEGLPVYLIIERENKHKGLANPTAEELDMYGDDVLVCVPSANDYSHLRLSYMPHSS
jgi:hypothetical protein